jgi:hypothetical protein
MRSWRILGLAGLAGLTAAGALLVTRRRHWRHYDADELRHELHDRFNQAQP